VVVILLEKVPATLRGELSRWMIEPKTGVFVGKLSAMVRDRLWERICEGMKGGSGILVHGTDTEQGFSFRFHGTPSRSVIDFDGLSLIRFS
jgi:CRISPR-associated protein Cas2